MTNRTPVLSQDDAFPPGTPDEQVRHSLALKERPTLTRPALYKVYILNDDFTPMEFVVDVLETYFGKSQGEATRIMLSVHQSGAGLCGVYSLDIAETKVALVHEAARKAEHPLRCTIERE